MKMMKMKIKTNNSNNKALTLIIFFTDCQILSENKDMSVYQNKFAS